MDTLTSMFKGCISSRNFVITKFNVPKVFIPFKAIKLHFLLPEERVSQGWRILVPTSYHLSLWTGIQDRKLVRFNPRLVLRGDGDACDSGLQLLSQT